jgi:hypothetical protein
MRDDQSVAFAQLVRQSRYAGDNTESRVRARLVAFEQGLEVGATRVVEPIQTSKGSIVPPSPNELFTWGSSGSLEMLLHDAIDRRNLVSFLYEGHARIVEPHVLGTKNGRLQILAWQVGGRSSSGNLPNWRRFFVHELSELEILNETFSGARPSWGPRSAFDRQIAVVRG